MYSLRHFLNDFWGGTAAMLVALPSAIAFGVSVYALIGGHYSAYGAVAGILGVAVIGIVASLLGGTKLMISAPSAPAAAILAAFAFEYINLGMGSDKVFVMIMVIAFMAGIFQILFGVIGLGRLIKYMPFPVVSGYLSAVGLYIISSQTSKFLGLPQEISFWETFQNPSTWQWPSIVVGTLTVLVMLMGSKLIKIIPAAIMALLFGTLSFFILGSFLPALFQPDNPMVIGTLTGSGGIDVLSIFFGRFDILHTFSWQELMLLIFPALTLAVLLSIDTLKTCVILDSMTHSFHDSNKELRAQGSANILSSIAGGMPGSGTVGATMINMSSGGKTRFSGLIEGVTAVFVFVTMAPLIAWIPVAALAGILIVIGFRMIDRKSFKLLKTRKTVFDFFIILSVVITALSVSLIAAAGVGLILAIVLYIVQQIGISVVYRHINGDEAHSKIIRNKAQRAILRQNSDEFSIYELHGALFFGTANQLYTLLQKDLQEKKFIIIDMKRVQTVDLTAAHILLQIKDILHDRNGYLLLSRLPHKLPTGEDMEEYFNHVGLLKHLSPIMVFDDLDDAIEWVENTIIDEEEISQQKEPLLELADFDLFKGRKDDTMNELKTLVESRSYKKGETIYYEGEGTGEIFLIRRGLVRTILPYEGRVNLHLNTLGQNNFFGEFSFLEGKPHYTDTVAETDTDLYCITRESFERFAENHKKAAFHFMQSLAAVLAERLRTTRSELGAEYDV